MTDGFGRLADCLADRYRLEHVLGTGGMATVYLAHDIRHDRSVAVKVLKPELAEWLGVERFLAEIKTTARLRHPHILPLFDSGDADGALYYVMPVVEGMSLRQLLDRDGRLPLEEALRIVTEVADALAYAHTREIVHRDIKPENILLEGGRVLVVDFGIARVMRELDDPRRTQSGHALGTPLYMSPEQAAGEAVVDGRSDLYSLACVLFEMLTGQPPFTGATAEAILVQRFTRAAPRVTALRDDVPASIEATIRRALSRAPEDRHASVTVFATQLREAPAIAAAEHSIAVLPFVNMSADPENEYFSDGIAEDIINALAHVAGLRVAARTSSFSFKRKTVDLREIGERLNVGRVLEGSVRKAGSRLRITAQLITVSDGYPEWSGRYDRDMTDVFAVQDEIATTIAAQLQVTFTRPSSNRRTGATSTQVEAYELYLKARALLAKRGQAVLEAMSLLERSIALDASVPQAHAAQGEAMRMLAWFGFARASEAVPRAKAALSRALALEPALGEALGTNALIALTSDRDPMLAFELWDRALAHNPMLTEVRASYAAFGLCILRSEDTRAIAEARRAVADDPLSPVCASYYAGILGVGGRCSDAIAEAQRAVSLDGESFLARLMLSWTYAWGGDVENALDSSRKALVMSGRSSLALAGIAALHTMQNDRDRALASHQELLARSAIDVVDPTWLAVSALGVGAVDEAMEHSFRAVEERAPQMIWLVRRPGTEALHAHPRYPELRQRMGM